NKARTAAISANGDAFFTKPFDIKALVEKLRELTLVEAPETYRVLIIDDTGKYAFRYATILQQAGMNVKVLSEPMRIMETLDKFPPALALINTQFQNLSGLELAMLIRQQEKYVQLPMVFFAQQFDQTLRRAVMQGVGDDYLNESVSSGQLVETVVSRIQSAEQRNDRQGKSEHRDWRSGLYNRKYFLVQLELANKRTDAAHPPAVMHISLDNYRGLSKIMGLTVTDAVVMDTARLLQEQINKQDLLARYDDSVFVILSYNRSLENVQSLAESIRASLEQHVVKLSGQSIVSTCSIGAAIYNKKVSHLKQLLADAESVCHNAGNEGGNRVCFHNYVQAKHLEEEHQSYWHEVILLALKNDTFYLVYQPIANLHGQARSYYDILLRLHGDQGEEGILATKFLSIAEQSKLILQVDRWVIKQATASLAEQYRNGQRPHFFIRISRASLSDDTLLPWIQERLTELDIPSNAIVFDISQTAIHECLEDAQRFVSGIKKAGCSFALRDFDDEPQAYRLLKLLDVDFIKVQRDLVLGLTDNTDNSEAIQAIVENSHKQSKTVIAPFVENANSLNLLWCHQVDYIVGHFVQAPCQRLDYDFAGMPG
ncbi:MAG: EAL domain-containing protein, partial [Gammaproteobacteria bacterium]|nr:EAL domain-containing protein [Gammaproteobacteria bacterium]